jgi:hypothetical protein
MLGDRTESLNLIASTLERIRSCSKPEAAALIDGLPTQLHPDARAVLANVEHYIADYDLRGRDDVYRRAQEQDLESLILALRRGDSREELLDYTFLP